MESAFGVDGNASNSTNTTDTVFKQMDKDHMVAATVLSSIALLFNVFLINIICGKEKLRERRSNKFLVNLLIANSCVSLGSLSFDVYSLSVDGELQDKYHDIHVMFDLILGTTNVLLLLSLTALSVDRLCTTKWPFRYLQYVKERHLYQAVVFSWMTALFYFTFLFVLCKIDKCKVQNKILHTTIKISISLGFVTLSTSSVIIFIEARKHLRKIHSPAGAMDKDTTKINIRVKRENRLALISVGVVLKFLACWIPAVVLITLEYLNKENHTMTFAYTAWQLDTVNCICDPIIYICLSKDVKEEFLRLCNQTNKDTDTTEMEEISVDQGVSYRPAVNAWR